MLSRQGAAAAPPPPRPLLSSPMSNTKKNGRVEGALDRADEEDGKTRGWKSKRGLHKKHSEREARVFQEKIGEF